MEKEALQLNPDTVAHIMHYDFIRVEKGDTFSRVSKAYRAYEKTTGKSPSILVFHDRVLVGTLPVASLILYKQTQKISRYIHPIANIHRDAHQRSVLQTFRKHPHDKVAVVDDENSVVGILYSDDVLRFLQENHASSLFQFAGVQAEEKVLDNVFVKVGHRYKWLVVNLATGFFAAFIVSRFEATIASFVLLAVYMPIVAGMGGNAATQTLAVMVRGIALHEVDLRTALPVLRKEVTTGMINGFLNGTLVAGIVYVLHGEILLSFVLGFAMVVNLVVAGFFGTLVPLVMERLGKDPAASATIFITTATDVLGFLAFLGLATVLFR